MGSLSLLLLGTAVVGALLCCLLSFLSLSRRSLPLPPGPKGWPILGNLHQLGGKPHQTLAALSRKYGPLLSLRFGSVQAVVASSASIAAAFLKTHDANFANRPPNSGAEHVAYNYRDMVFAPYGPLWRTLRKISSVHLFSVKALENFRHVREEEAAQLARALLSRGEGGGMANLGEEVNVCAVNALSRAMMGRRVFGSVLGKEAEEFKKMVVELMQLAGVFNVGDFVPCLSWLDLQGVVSRMKSLHSRYDGMLNGIIKAHEATVGSAVITTRRSTRWWKGRLVADSDLGSLPFLRAVVKEVFRMHPSTPLSLPRMAAESCEIEGYHIPKGATLLVNVWAISRDPRSGPVRSSSARAGTDFEVIPFGAGRRICAGMRLGLRMVEFLTATLVHAFDWELPPGERPEKLDMEEAYGLTLQRAVPLRVRPVPRLDLDAYSAAK
ncbi:unnamed protein product [Spirodela intermedia]|uniref:Uncharacterized protein n=1 Tax=Spirodela intermedia TaxID=51605 RepID=A0A7I8IHX4_SPIIN|nr:unnamed protein product [Spirodela intermedia]CAA6657394.1 unnamed protein product [Spirodela intermedia]